MPILIPQLLGITYFLEAESGLLRGFGEGVGVLGLLEVGLGGELNGQFSGEMFSGVFTGDGPKASMYFLRSFL
jgi:hypothetical protein